MSRFLYAVLAVGLAAVPCGAASGQASATASVVVKIVEPASVELTSALGLTSTSSGPHARRPPPRGDASFRLGAAPHQEVSLEVSEALVLSSEHGGPSTGRARVTTNARPQEGLHARVFDVTAEANMASGAEPGVHKAGFRMIAHLN